MIALLGKLKFGYEINTAPFQWPSQVTTQNNGIYLQKHARSQQQQAQHSAYRIHSWCKRGYQQSICTISYNCYALMCFHCMQYILIISFHAVVFRISFHLPQLKNYSDSCPPFILSGQIKKFGATSSTCQAYSSNSPTSCFLQYKK